MELIKECCNNNARNKFSLLQHQKNRNELQQLLKDTTTTMHLNPNERNTIQFYEREQNQIVEYLERKIEKNQTCCQIIKKILFHQIE